MSASLIQQETLLTLLGLADELIEGEFQDRTYIFYTGVATIRLYHYSLDGDTTITITLHDQVMPLLRLNLLGCELYAVSDAARSYIEFTGRAVEEGFVRQKPHTLGFRLHLGPSVWFEPFLVNMPPRHS